MTMKEYNKRVSKGEPALRSCWNCNSAHKHLKKADYIIYCFICGKIYYKGKKLVINDKEEEKMEYEDYLEEMKKLNKRHLHEETDEDYEDVDDNEAYHIKMDDILVRFIESLGYKEMVELYKKAEKHFWYS